MPVEPSVAEKFAKRDALIRSGDAFPDTTHRVLLGDARSMPELRDREVHLVVTSPPYWNLKRYAGAAGSAQLGHIESYEHFLDQLDAVWKRCLETLVPGGRLCVNVGDVCLPRRSHGRHSVVPLHADISARCRKLGFDYLTPILWHKIANAVTEVDGAGAFLGKPYEPNAVIKNDCEYVLLLRKPGSYRKPTETQRLLSLIDKKDHARWFRSVWTDIRGAPTTQGHPAPFPTEFAYRLIRMFSFVGDVVLDPFVGSGTTIEAAKLASRSSVSYEIEPHYYESLTKRFAQLEPSTTMLFARGG